jgi:type I restriction-modification system DNA methylase subunit
MAQYTKEELREIFRAPFNRDAWKAILHNLFRAENIRLEAELFTDPNEPEQGYYMGVHQTTDAYSIGLFYYKINQGSVAHKKIGLRNLVKRFINPTWGNFDAAIVVFNDGQEWRLSFVCDIKDVATTPKRFTYVFGEHDNFYRTPLSRFMALQSKEATFENIREAFSVDALSDDFFDRYRELYADFVQYITGKRFVKEGGKWVERQLGSPNYQYETTFEEDDKLVRDYIKKMFGRIVFLYFLQRKGWLNNDRQYMHNLFYNSDQKDNFLDGVLEALFFEVLNTDKPYRTDAAKQLPGSENIPYLNGGLFAQDEIDALDCVFPEDYFKRLFDFLDSYNFTIDENDAEDAEIGIDPEMLGRIFENLLEDNKDKGAFYTPKEIVNYMCRESIINFLINDMPEHLHDGVRHLVETFDATKLDDQTKVDIRRKLQGLKICDPAIGSGAFPMGLVNLLSRLYVAMKADTDTTKMKRHIMENNIYGVDIEQGAVDIARLRFWLAMIVEEKEPMPLPNLHFKIMHGNSLIESCQGVDLSDLTKSTAPATLFFESKDTDREDLRDNLKAYYGTSNHAEREQRFTSIIRNVRRQMYDKNPYINQAGLDPSSTDKFFLWHTWFSDIFDKGGFDIVIGNPPYIQLQKATGRKAIDKKGKEYDEKLGDLYVDCGYETFEKTGDIYCLFYEKGLSLLKPHGTLCYITSNKWMRAGYGESIRGFFAKKSNPVKLIDLSGVKIFDNATVDVNILFLKKEENMKSTIACKIDNADSVKNLSDFVQQQGTRCAFTTSESWVILSPIEQSIKQKIEAVGTPLKDWDIQINYGIKTGFNDAFIVSTETRDKILQNCKTEEERIRTAELIRPILRGRDIKRYGYDWAGLWLINTHNGVKGKFPRIDINDYPSVKAHLDQYWDKIEKRADQGDTPYNLRNCAYVDDFNKPKIIYPNMTKYMPFVYDDSAYTTNQKCFIITGKNVAFLTAFFNSSLFKFCFRDSFPELQGGTRELSKIFFDKIPVINVDSSIERKFKDIVQDIQLYYTKEKAHQIDIMFFDLFNLSDEERSVIGFIDFE